MPLFFEKVVLKPYLAISRFSWKEIDLKIVDTIVDAIAKTIYTTGNESRVMQTRNLSTALRWMAFGLLVLLILAILLVSNN